MHPLLAAVGYAVLTSSLGGVYSKPLPASDGNLTRVANHFTPSTAGPLNSYLQEIHPYFERPFPANTLFDTLIVGGGPSGLGVATTLARMKNKALVLDSGFYRNSRATHMHNVIGWDHTPPPDFRHKARTDLFDKYETISFKQAKIRTVSGDDEQGFQATDEGNNTYYGRKLVLATGIQDLGPDIPGFAEAWGRGIYHCLFCDGFEQANQSSAGVLAVGTPATPANVIEIAFMVLALERRAIIYTHGNATLTSLIEANLTSYPGANGRITVEGQPIARFNMSAPYGAADDDNRYMTVTLANGTQRTEAFLAYSSETMLVGDLHDQLGLERNVKGGILTFDPTLNTTRPGVYSVGDAGTLFRAAAHAGSGGAKAGMGISEKVQAQKARGDTRTVVEVY